MLPGSSKAFFNQILRQNLLLLFAGVYEDSFENIDALLNLPRPQPAFATAAESSGVTETASGGHPEEAGRLKKLRAGGSTSLLGLPNLLLIEVLNWCSRE
jgi:hypothetical protein